MNVSALVLDWFLEHLPSLEDRLEKDAATALYQGYGVDHNRAETIVASSRAFRPNPRDYLRSIEGLTRKENCSPNRIYVEFGDGSRDLLAGLYVYAESDLMASLETSLKTSSDDGEGEARRLMSKLRWDFLEYYELMILRHLHSLCRNEKARTT